MSAFLLTLAALSASSSSSHSNQHSDDACELPSILGGGRVANGTSAVLECAAVANETMTCQCLIGSLDCSPCAATLSTTHTPAQSLATAGPAPVPTTAQPSAAPAANTTTNTTAPLPPPTPATVATVAPSPVPATHKPLPTDYCEWSAATHAPWGPTQREVCCRANGFNGMCRTEDLRAERAACVRGEGDAEVCCARHGVRCSRAAYDCFGDGGAADVAGWSAAQRDWCCLESDVGCAHSCLEAASLMSPAQREYCCRVKGAACTEAWWAQHTGPAAEAQCAARAAHTRRRRLTLRSAAEDAVEAPKRVIRGVRLGLLLALPELRERPDELRVDAVGVLMAGGVVPPADKQANGWAVQVPCAWNEELYGAEKGADFFDAARRALVLSADDAATAAAQEGVFVDVSVGGASADAAERRLAEVDAALADAAEGRGPLSSSNGGLTLAVVPVLQANETLSPTAGTAAPAPSKDKEERERAAWMLYVAGVCGTLVVGGILLLVRRRIIASQEKKLPKNAALSIDECEALQTFTRSPTTFTSL
eukprot:Rhum_TRINITY_DN12351_c0_g1::Rhum_TRINITY_DN12351_c0_g1_i1::g.51276::m.51276